MYCNMGMTDRYFRIFIGLALFSQAFIGFQQPIFLFGFFPLLMGLSGWCPAFSLINWSTMTEKEMEEQIQQFKKEEQEFASGSEKSKAA